MAFAGGVGFDVDDLGQLAAKQRKGPANVDHANRLLKSIENEDVGGK